jgi:hypothetical protein
MFRRVATGVAGAGLLVGVGMLPAAAVTDAVDSPDFPLRSGQCDSGPSWGASLFTRVSGGFGADGDHDVNTGAQLSTSLLLKQSIGAELQGVSVDFETPGGVVPVGPSTVVPAGDPTVMGTTTTPYTVKADDEGAVLLFSVSRHRVAGSNLDCTPNEGDGVVGVYVNRPPVPADDSASTNSVSPVSIDVLANDDATWDSGTITSANPTLTFEVGDQDNLEQIPDAERQGAVEVTTDPADGTTAVDADGQVTYTPDAGFVGDDEFTYRVTDNDGAAATATATIEVTTPVVDSIQVTPSQTEVDQDGSVTLTATGFDDDGDNLGDVTDDVTFTSDVATDQIDGNTVTFPHASPHTITGTHTGGATFSVLINVTGATTPADEPSDDPGTQGTEDPADAALPDTGGAPVGLMWTAAALLAVGAAILTGARRRRRGTHNA